MRREDIVEVARLVTGVTRTHGETWKDIG